MIDLEDHAWAYIPFYGEIKHETVRGLVWTKVVAIEFQDQKMSYRSIQGVRIPADTVQAVNRMERR